MVKDVVRRIPKHSVVEVEKPITKYEVDYDEHIVEVPQVEYVDRTVEVPTIKETVRHVVVKKIQDVPYEVIKKVPKVEYVEVEKTVKVPGDRVEVEKPYIVKREVEVKRYKDKEVLVVVAQTIQPTVVVSQKTVEVPVYQYEPQLVYVDVFVPKPVPLQLISAGVSKKVPHYPVTVPPAQYNTLLKSLNSNLPSEELKQLPYVQENGTIPFLSQYETPGAAVLSSQNTFSLSEPIGNATNRTAFSMKGTDGAGNYTQLLCWKKPQSASTEKLCYRRSLHPTYYLRPDGTSCHASPASPSAFFARKTSSRASQGSSVSVPTQASSLHKRSTFFC